MSDPRVIFEERLSEVKRMHLFRKAAINECEFNHHNTSTECTGDVKIFYIHRSTEFWAFCDAGAEWNRGRGVNYMTVVA